MVTKVRLVPLAAHVPVAVSLACLEWHETEQQYRTGRFQPAIETYLAWDRAGMFRYFVLLEDDEVIGHMAFVVSPSRTTSGLEANEEFVYIRPDKRKGWAGVRLVADAIEFLKLNGVGDIFVGSKLTASKPIDKLLQRLGGRHVANLYVF